MKSLRWLTPVLCLLLVALAASPSEAAAPATKPIVSITTEDGTFTVPFTSDTGTCLPTDSSAGYTACYPITLGSYGNTSSSGGHGQWVISNDDPTATTPARLLIADTACTAPATCLDAAVLSGVRFRPDATGSKTLTVTSTVTFDTTGGINPAGAYSVSLRAGGWFKAGTDGNNKGDSVSLKGSGWFGAQTCPDNCFNTIVPISPDLALSPTPINVAGLSVGWSLGHTPVYPTFDCNTGSDGGSQCAPIITQNLTFTVTNRDILVLANSNDMRSGTWDNFPFPEGRAVGLQLVVPPGASSPITPLIRAANRNAAILDRQAAMADGAVLLPTRCREKFHSGGGEGEKDDD